MIARKDRQDAGRAESDGVKRLLGAVLTVSPATWPQRAFGLPSQSSLLGRQLTSTP